MYSEVMDEFYKLEKQWRHALAKFLKKSFDETCISYGGEHLIFLATVLKLDLTESDYCYLTSEVLDAGLFPLSFLNAISFVEMIPELLEDKNGECIEDRFYITEGIKMQVIINYSRLIALLMQNRIVHSSAYLRKSRRTVIRLSDFSKFPRGSADCRKCLELSLIDEGVNNSLARLMSRLHPVSHLEGRAEVERQAFNLRASSCISSIFGMAADPVLAATVHKSNMQLFYVQHGGAYGQLKRNIIEYLEKNNCDHFLHWGFGANNISQTRFFRKKRKPHFEKTQSIVILLSYAGLVKNSQPQRVAYNTKKSVESALWVARRIDSLGIESLIAKHPRDKKLNVNGNVCLGISEDMMLDHKLVVFDCPYHTLFYSVIENDHPFVILDDVEIVQHTKEYQYYHDLMKSVGIIISSGCAPEKLKIIYNDVDGWWNSKDLRRFRTEMKKFRTFPSVFSISV